MSPEQTKALVEKALSKAAASLNPTEALAWLKVADGWLAAPVDLLEGEEDEDGFLTLSPVRDEHTRITLRLSKEGAAIVICDQKDGPVHMTRADTPAEAAQVAMGMLDSIE